MWMLCRHFGNWVIWGHVCFPRGIILQDSLSLSGSEKFWSWLEKAVFQRWAGFLDDLGGLNTKELTRFQVIKMPRLDEALWVFKGPGYNLEMHLLRMNLDDGKKWWGVVGGGDSISYSMSIPKKWNIHQTGKISSLNLGLLLAPAFDLEFFSTLKNVRHE